MPVLISDNKRIIALILILLIITLASGLSATWLLYQTAIDNMRKNLSDIAHLQLSTIESIHRLKGTHDTRQVLQDDKEVVDMYVGAIKRYKQAHEGVEIDIATQQDNKLVFIFPENAPQPVQQPTMDKQAERLVPMRLALSGKTGTVIGVDSYGNSVLAAYEHSEALSMGVVAKVAIDKLQQPFIKASFYVLLVSIVLVLLGVYFFFKIGSPIIRKVRDNEERFRGLFNESTYFVALLSPEGRIEMLNDTAREHFKLSNNWQGQLLYQLPFWQHSKEEQAKVEKSIHDLSADSIVRFGTNCSLPDGSLVDIDFSIKPITDSDNTIVNIIAAGNDISELMNSQKSLIESQQRYQSLVESSEATPWEMDFNLKQFIYVGGQAVELLAYPIQQWYEENFWYQHIHPDDQDEALAFCQQALTAGGNYDHRFRMISQQGETVWIHNYINVVYKGEKPVSLSGYMFNISEHMEYEQQLQRSQKMEALGQVTGGIAHDYNNMLGIIMGYSNILLSKLSSQPALLKYAQRINEAGQRNAKLTQKLLAFSREKTLEAEKVNLNEILEEMQHLLEKTLTARIKLVMALSEELWDVKLDKGDFVDALLNMSINAMHAMEQGGELTLSTENIHLQAMEANTLQVDPGDYVLFLIQDTGIGIDDYIQSKMFDPFFSTKGKDGSGLGLSQVYSFIKQLGGAIKVNSEIGKGTRFFIYIPRFSSEEETDVIEPDLPQYTKGEETILIVDDEPMLAEMTGEYLKIKGYQVIYAESAEQALDILSKQDIDLMVSDIIMPGMDGYQLAVRVKEFYPNVKIQLVTGYSDGKHLDQNNKLVDPVLHKNLIYKPFEVNDLLIQIRNLLDSEEVATDNEAHGRHAKEGLARLEWNDSLSVHVADIDEQHKFMFGLFNEFQEAIQKKDDDLISNNFNNLIDYINYHFQREEEVMQACDYQGLKKHHQVHVLFKKQILDYYEDFKKGQLNIQELSSLYRNWLIDHVSGMDQAIGVFCKDKQEEIERELQQVERVELAREDDND